MASFKNALTLTSILCLSSVAFADTVNLADDEDRDIRALREWIDTKRQVSLKEIGGDLSISGEVRTEFQASDERVNGRKQRGQTGDLRGTPDKVFDIEFNLMLDYRTDRTWASVKVEFDEDAGVFGGTSNKVALERAYWAVRAFEGDNYNIDIEVGRRSMSSHFESKVQFGSTFDGIMFRYDHAYPALFDFYIHAGPYIINDFKKQFGYVGEIGFLNIVNTGVYAKLSFIDWKTKHYNEHFLNNRFRFVISQLTGGYRFKINCIDKVGVVYSAFLWNYAAKRLHISDHLHANWGAYLGFSLGQLRKQWDWAFDINYQAVAAQAVPDFDVTGVGLGNASRLGFYTKTVTPLRGGGPNLEPIDARGGTNFRGFMVSLDVLLTDKLDLQQSYLNSVTLDNRIGPHRQFSQYEIEFIYTW